MEKGTERYAIANLGAFLAFTDKQSKLVVSHDAMAQLAASFIKFGISLLEDGGFLIGRKVGDIIYLNKYCSDTTIEEHDNHGLQGNRFAALRMMESLCAEEKKRHGDNVVIMEIHSHVVHPDNYVPGGMEAAIGCREAPEELRVRRLAAATMALDKFSEGDEIESEMGGTRLKTTSYFSGVASILPAGAFSQESHIVVIRAVECTGGVMRKFGETGIDIRNLVMPRRE